MATYQEYIVDAASNAADFGRECLNIAADFAANVPEFAAQTAAASSEYLQTSAVAIARMTTNTSYEAYNAVVSSSSSFAESLEAAAASYPTWGDRLRSAAADYSAQALAAALGFLSSGAAAVSPLQWIQKQDDGIFTNGNGGTSGGAGASGDWGFPEPPKYPEGVPVVPPQIIPGEKERITKIQPQPPTQPKGCVNKREPTIGEISHITPVMMPGPARFDVYWFDNIVERSQQKQYGHEAVERTQYKGTPCGMPALAAEMFADFPNGRYKVETVEHNIVGYMSTNPRFYDAVEGWYWKGDRIYTPVTIRSHGDDYHECLAIEFQDFSGMYLYQYSYGWDEEGKGHAVHYTYGRARIVFLGAEFPPVVETPKISPVFSVGMAVNQHIFRTLSFLGGLWGRYEPF